MRQYQKWLSAGLVALTPGIAMAGAIDSPILKPVQRTAAAAPRSAKKSRPAANQELADNVAKALRNSNLNGYAIDIDALDGVVILEGTVAHINQRAAAGKAAKSVSGVTAVKNRLRVVEPVARPLSDRAAVTPAQPGDSPQIVEAAGYVSIADHSAAVEQAADSVAGPVVIRGQNPSPPPGMAAGAPQAPAAVYAPSVQPAPAYYAGPMYMPNQSSAGAWPYMGPFHPYPQCPLGWRKVSMYWDEGLWKIDFGGKKAWWQK